MYPVLIRIGTFEITSFGAMVALAALVGLWLFRRELQRSGLPLDAADAGIVGVIGGLAGAKLLWTGLSWYGGLIGGVGAGFLYIALKGWPVVPTLAAATPALAFGHLIGRIGCFLVGDDYGRPSNLPWAVAFPEGLPPTTVPVHPTQIYEAIGLGLLGWCLLRWRRQRVPDAIVLGRYLLAAGALRFGIEFLRVNVRVAFGLSVAHIVSLIAIAAAVATLVVARGTPPRADPRRK
jgi:phosphatidylglycerol:prolipoprotein diacylglycerol transferase